MHYSKQGKYTRGFHHFFEVHMMIYTVASLLCTFFLRFVLRTYTVCKLSLFLWSTAFPLQDLDNTFFSKCKNGPNLYAF